MDMGSEGPAEGSPRAREAAEQALHLDETIGEAHASLGLAYTCEYRWAESEREYRRAIELNPMYASAHQWYYMDLLAQGRVDEARRELAAAEEADPLSPIILFHKGYLAWIEGHDDAALESWRRSSQLGGDAALFHLFMICFHVRRSEFHQAVAHLAELPAQGGGYLGPAAPIAGLAALGRREEAERAAAALEAEGRKEFVIATGPAWIYGVLGDSDRFFDWLSRSVDSVSKPFDFVTNPMFAPMRADPRLREYLRRFRLA